MRFEHAAHSMDAALRQQMLSSRQDVACTPLTDAPH
jgi:hypothetical protein